MNLKESTKAASKKSGEDPIHVHDIQATILYQLGIDHERLTFTCAGRPFELTDVHGSVIKKLVV